MQVLINLVKNALKFTQLGTIEMIVSYNCDLQRLHVKVKDTGVGISAEDMPNLFRLFGKL